jgi:hypothetical protein
MLCQEESEGGRERALKAGPDAPVAARHHGEVVRRRVVALTPDEVAAVLTSSSISRGARGRGRRYRRSIASMVLISDGA